MKMASSDTLSNLYPEGLSLRSVHIFFRHGARTPTAPIFTKEHGLPIYWPLCAAARQMSNPIVRLHGPEKHNTFQWKKVFETIRPDDGPIISANGLNLCNHGELTDHGRLSMLALGQRLRHLYVDKLKLLPTVLTSHEMVYFRSSPFPRALESLQHVISGFFPAGTLKSSFGDPQIVVRDPREETLLPNEDHCERFIQICKAYSRRTAHRWNDTVDMQFLNTLLRKGMPPQKRVAVDSTPSMHAIHDAITATAASGSPDIRLPEEFYDSRVGDIIDKIAFEEEYSAFQEGQEMRRVGIGALLGDVVERMVLRAEEQALGLAPSPKLFLCASHDSTLAAIMASLGAVDATARRKWPPYGSVLAIELFQDSDAACDKAQGKSKDISGLPLIGRSPTTALKAQQKRRLEDHYVRIRYNDRSLVVPGCREPGRNWRGDESFCTLAAFKEIVDRFTPTNWRQACMTNLDKSEFPEKIELAGV